MSDDNVVLLPLDRLTRDLKKASSSLTVREARYLVNLYYMNQGLRIRAQAQASAMDKREEKEPHATLDWFTNQGKRLEDSTKDALGEFARGRIVGQWSQSILGIGPVISAGLIAYINMIVWTCAAPHEVKVKRFKPDDQCNSLKPCSPLCREEQVNTVSRIWRYAGLDPTVTWGKGEKRPWNAALKVLCWKIGESFVKQANREADVYGKIYQWRKAREIEKNEKKDFAEQARRILTSKNIGKTTEAYKWYSQDMLPPAQIQRRSTRYAVKLFLSHWHMVAYREAFGKLPPKPYALDILGHKDMIQVPNWPWPGEGK